MTTAFEVGSEPCLEDFSCLIVGHKASWKREYVSVVMLACETCDILIPGDGGPDTFHLICRDRHSCTRAANEQTLFELCARLATKHRLASSRQAVSQHIDVLVAAGLVETRREGRYKFHHFNPRPLEQIADRWRRSVDTPEEP